MKIKKVTTDCIFFDNGSMLESYHKSYCCEDHYVDFTSINDQGWEGQDFPETLKELLSYDKQEKIDKNHKVPSTDSQDYNQNPYTFVKIRDLEGSIYILNIYNSNNGWYANDVSLVYTSSLENAEYKVKETIRIQ